MSASFLEVTGFDDATLHAFRAGERAYHIERGGRRAADLSTRSVSAGDRRLCELSGCKPPVLTEQEMRVQAHGRAERGTSCCLAGTCECGGAYKRDPEINDRVVAAIRGEKRLRDTSVWVTTMRKFVTLQGCVHDPTQKKTLERLFRRQPDVAIVWNETTIGVNAPKKPKR